MRRLALGAVAAIGLLAAACGADPPTLPEGADAELQLGEQVYGSQCSRCHRADGGGGRGPKLSDGAFREEYPTLEDQVLLIERGRGSMPAFGDRLSEGETLAVIRYVDEILVEN